MAAAIATGGHPDPRDAQITKLKAGNAALKARCAGQDQAITALEDQRTLALSRLAAQHDEIQRLRAAADAAGTGNIRALHTAPAGTTDHEPRKPMTSPDPGDLAGALITHALGLTAASRRRRVDLRPPHLAHRHRLRRQLHHHRHPRRRPSLRLHPPGRGHRRPR